MHNFVIIYGTLGKLSVVAGNIHAKIGISQGGWEINQNKPLKGDRHFVVSNFSVQNPSRAKEAFIS